MSAFLDRIVDDLRSFAPELLEAGLAPAVQAAPERGPPPSVSAVVRAVDNLSALLPRLIEECVGFDGSAHFDVCPARTPRGATLSRRPVDYGVRGGVAMPQRFEVMTPLPEPDPAARRFLLHWVGVLGDHLLPAARRTRKQVETARLARAGGSVFAEDDERGLRKIESHLLQADAQLARMRATLRRAARTALRPASTPPHPFPRTPAWRALRRLTVRWADGVRVCLEEVRQQFTVGAKSADLPYLYQRWCGVKLLEGLAAAGLKAQSDAVGALFLGGKIALSDGRVPVALWVEPRLTRSLEQPTGFRCRVGEEVTPDYMLVVSGPQGPDAFVLDATKTSDEEVIRHKFSYLTRIGSAGTRLVAGVPLSYAPLRSWAAAPVAGIHCRLESSDGRKGVIPMHPGAWSSEPVAAWARDVVDYARAWSQAKA